MGRYTSSLALLLLAAPVCAFLSPPAAGICYTSASPAARRGVVARAANPDHEVNAPVDLTGVVAAMEEWVACCMAPEGHSKRHLKHIVSTGTTVPAVLADFWHAVGSCVDKQRLAPDDRSFRCLHILTAPFCEPLRTYQTMAVLDRLLERAAFEGGCRHFGVAQDSEGVTAYHNHPRYRNTPAPATKAYAVRHSPYPSFSLAAHFKSGGGAQSRWPMPPAGHEPPPTTQPGARRLAPRPMPQQTERSSGAAASGGGATGGPAGNSGNNSSPQKSRPEASPKRSRKAVPRPDRDWASRVRVALEAAYAKAAVSASDDKVETRGAPPASSVAVLQATRDWVLDVLQDADDGKNHGLVSSSVVRRMQSVGTYYVTRSSYAEDLFADVWDAVVDVTNTAAAAGCKLPADDQPALNRGAGSPPCYSAILVAPDFDAACSEGFRRFGDILRATLQYLPVEDDISIEVFHPEFVTHYGQECDRSALRRSPWPTIHICYEGPRMASCEGGTGEKH